MKKQFFISVLILSAIISCTKGSDSSHNNNTTACTGTKSFSADVNPIVQSVCAASGCHNTSSTNGPGALTTYQQVFNARATIRSAVASGTMPQNTTLTEAQKSAIICWIDSGAANN